MRWSLVWMCRRTDITLLDRRRKDVSCDEGSPSSSIVLYPGVYHLHPEGWASDLAPKTISVKAATGWLLHYGGTVELKGTYNDKMAAAALDAAAALRTRARPQQHRHGMPERGSVPDPGPAAGQDDAHGHEGDDG